MKCPLDAKKPRKEQRALPLEQCLAKTFNGGVGETILRHSCIAWRAAMEIMAMYKHGLFPEHAEVLSYLHDIGKISPCQQARLYNGAGIDITGMPELADAELSVWDSSGGHAAAGAGAILAMWPDDMPLEQAEACAGVVGGHHGRRTKPMHIGLSGGQAWQEKRLQLVANAPCQLAWPDIRTLAQFQICSGLVSTADWIASGAPFEDPSKEWTPERVRHAVRAFGFALPELHAGLSFADACGFAPNAVQRSFVKEARTPGIYIAEAGMGQGKTEAALYAAYGLMAAGLARGMYFALPTRLTSNKIHARLQKFLNRICRSHAEAKLIHAGAWLEHMLARQTKEGAAAGACWHDAKRLLMAPFGVGTIDQLLMAVINVRHAGMRNLGIAGKVVILDEVHSYDVYTGSLLCVLVQRLRELGCTVLILSATLTAERRAKLLSLAEGDTSACPAAYPLVSALPEGQEQPSFVDPTPPAPASCLLKHVASTDSAMNEAIRRAMRGEHVLWIENTVGEAQAVFSKLSSLPQAQGIPVGLLHSRFTAQDRSHNEDYWTSLYAPKRKKSAEGFQGMLLVGTQVLEQSLDLDADFLVTRFCPSDMLFQRLGRLWRNAETERPEGASREAWLLHPSLEAAQADPEGAFGVSGRVYAPYVLLRSLEVWADRTSVCLPTDIRGVMEATYAHRDEVPGSPAERVWQAMHSRDVAMQNLAWHAQSKLSPEMQDDGNALTRLSERHVVPVLIVLRLDKEAQLVVLADGTHVTLGTEQKAGWQKRRSEEAAKLALSCVSVPAWQAPKGAAPSWLTPWLSQGTVCAVLKQNERLAKLDGAVLPRASYSSTVGWAT